MQTIAEVFGDNLRRVRNKAGLTQKQLAVLSGLSASFVSHMEQGLKAPNIENVVRMANALRVPVRVLVEGFDPPAPKDPSGAGTASS